jgi:protein TonB
MKKVDISRLERHRSANLRIGFAAALFMAVLAFNWTVQRPGAPAFENEIFPTEAEVKVVRTAQKTPAAKPPPPVFHLSDKIAELPPVLFDPNPAVSIVDSSFFNQEPEPVVQPAKPAAPIFTPPRPEEKEPEAPFLIVEEMPRFPGCQEEGLSKKEKLDCATERLLQFLGSHIRYPSLAKDNGIEGTVVVRFIVEKDGSISQPAIIRDIGGGCGAEALRVVKSMPTWLPGKQQGRPVRVQFSLPVQFKLR